MDWSIIVPVFNCVSTLARCVSCLRRALPRSGEILLINDGSTDGSGELCEQLGREDSRIRVFHPKHSGVSAARNLGIREARGKYLLFADGDDTLDPNLLKQVLAQTRAAEADCTIYAMTFQRYFRGRYCSHSTPSWPWRGMLSRTVWTENLAALFENNALSPVWNKIFLRELLVKHDVKFREDLFLFEDLIFSLEYLALCGDILIIPEPVYHHRTEESLDKNHRRAAELKKPDSILMPAEQALRDAPPETRQKILMMLYQILAREKIAVSGLSGIDAVCRDYARWCRERRYDAPENRFHKQLTGRQAPVLWAKARYTGLRHRIALRVKSRLRGMAYGD